jgi:hypothetical protein
MVMLVWLIRKVGKPTGGVTTQDVPLITQGDIAIVRGKFPRLVIVKLSLRVFVVVVF